MSKLSDSFEILLIDDDPQEASIIERILAQVTDRAVTLHSVEKCSTAIARLGEQSYDLVLLDNRLSPHMSADFSVPVIKTVLGDTPLAVISSDTDVDYLQDPETLGVDFVVNKADMVAFLRDRTELGMGGTSRKADAA